MSRALAASGHDLPRLKSYHARCTRCQANIPTTNRLAWLRANPCRGAAAVCPPSAACAEQPQPIPQVTVGHRQLHHTHDIRRCESAGAWYCRTCGGIADLIAQSLAKPCDGEMLPHRAKRLDLMLTTGQKPWEERRRTTTAPGTNLPRQPTLRPASTPAPVEPPRIESDPHNQPAPSHVPTAEQRMHALREKVRAKELAAAQQPTLGPSAPIDESTRSAPSSL